MTTPSTEPSSALLRAYDPFGDPKVIGDPYCTVFVGRLSCFTDEETLKKAMSRYGRVKNLRLVRHIVTGASRGYAFVEYETEREMRRAYEEAHHSFIDGSEIIVDYNRQQLMPGWIPRRLGGGLGGKKESGQLRFGGRERPFRAPLRPIPFDDLKRLGIPPPPEGRYLTRFEVPSPPRRRNADDDENLPRRDRKRTKNRDASPPAYRIKSMEREEASTRSRKGSDDDDEEEDLPHRDRRRTKHRDESPPRYRRKSAEREEASTRSRKRSDGEEEEEEDSSRRDRKRAEIWDESPPRYRRKSMEREHKSTRSRKRSEEKDSSSVYRDSHVSPRRDHGEYSHHHKRRTTR
ncbi:hypothetical protein Taro_026850 [Colocasia esculenta]|uniref:RRM domain-containing protein n=1 Tax=Colocasia esculenta TaxID=4460 RepID=A0A843VLW5_COLES|nr:hypothetical protein [Colocasia esculenta]